VSLAGGPKGRFLASQSVLTAPGPLHADGSRGHVTVSDGQGGVFGASFNFPT